MKIVADLKAFNDAVRTISALVNSLSMVKTDQLLLISVKKDSTALTYADEDLYVTMSLVCEVGELGEIAVPLQYLLGFKSRAKSATISLSADKSLKINVQGGVSTDLAVLVETDRVKRMIPERVGKTNIMLPVKAVVTGLAGACFRATEDQPEPPVRIDLCKKTHTADFATGDPFRFAHVKVSSDDALATLADDITIILDKKPILAVIQKADVDDTVHLRIGRSSYTVRTSGITMQVPRNQSYDDVEGYDPKSYGIKLHSLGEVKGSAFRVSAKALVDAVSDVTRLFVGATGNPNVEMRLGKESLTLKSSSDVGSADCTIPVTATKRDKTRKSVVVDSGYFVELLGMLSGDVVVRWWDAETSTIFVEDSGGGCVGISESHPE